MKEEGIVLSRSVLHESLNTDFTKKSPEFDYFVYAFHYKLLYCNVYIYLHYYSIYRNLTVESNIHWTRALNLTAGDALSEYFIT